MQTPRISTTALNLGKWHHFSVYQTKHLKPVQILTIWAIALWVPNLRALFAFWKAPSSKTLLDSTYGVAADEDAAELERLDRCTADRVVVPAAVHEVGVGEGNGGGHQQVGDGQVHQVLGEVAGGPLAVAEDGQREEVGEEGEGRRQRVEENDEDVQARRDGLEVRPTGHDLVAGPVGAVLRGQPH